MRRARQLGIELPICAAVDAILDGHLGIAAALESLMSRPIRMEGG
jgi:glycerol-3-phosphate dehydrogenase (NAD(P)+)